MRLFYRQDVHYAFRLLARSPLFSVLTIVVLGGGLGISIFTFSFLYTLALRPLPIDGGKRVVTVLAHSATGGSTLLDAADAARIRPDITTLQSFGVYTTRALVLGTEAGGFALQATAAEWQMLDDLRVRPALGRIFRPGDAEPGAEPAIVLSWRAWRVGLGADTGIVGKHVTLNGVPTRVLGVMPPEFGFPVAAEAWIPIAPEILVARERGTAAVNAYGRLAPGATAASAEAELGLLIRRALPARREAQAEAGAVGALVNSFPLTQIGEDAPLFLTVLNGIAALILLLACVNVTNLLLARANERDRELAVRLALGASRPRLILQNLWESVILCVLSGILATGLAGTALRFVNDWAHANLAENLAFWWVWGFDLTTVFAAGGFVTLAIAGLGGVVSWRASNTRLIAVMNDGGVRSGGRRGARVSRFLVLLQVVTVSVLMFIGCLSGVVAWRAVNLDPGYDTHRLLVAGLSLPPERYPDAGRVGGAFTAVRAQIESRREINGVILRATIAGLDGSRGLLATDGPTPAEGRPASFIMAVDGALSVLGIPLEQGRAFEASDGPAGARTAIVSRSMATRFWPGESPIGRRVRTVGLADSTAWRTVVGIAGDILLGNPLSRDRSAVALYLPLAQTDARDVDVMFRHRGDIPAASGAVLEIITGVDPLLVPGHVSSFDDMLAKGTTITKSVTILFGTCFLFALVLAVSGTYGLMARSISQRTREIGVRRALGATDRTVVRLLLGQGARQLGIGALFALPLTGFIGFAFSRFFPLALALSLGLAFLVSVAITAVVLAATWIPTRRAVRVEVRDALWHE